MTTVAQNAALHAAVAAQAPIDGVCSDGTIWFTPSGNVDAFGNAIPLATLAQQQAAHRALIAFDMTKVVEPVDPTAKLLARIAILEARLGVTPAPGTV